MGENAEVFNRLKSRVKGHLDFIYGQTIAENWYEKIIQAMDYSHDSISEPPPYQNYWDENDCWIITYANSIKEEGVPGLQTLAGFCQNYLAEAINGIHILPFYPYSSDDGFAVIDYLEVHEEAGSWGDVEALSKEFRIMADLVINHGSSQSVWFQNFLSCKEPGATYFKETAPSEDLSKVVRPRSSPLKVKVETVEGEKWLWCTFGSDQVDFDYSNPEVLLRFVEIIAFYLTQGISVFRLDAVAFLWKEPGTTSLHDQKTHEIVKLIRTLLDFYDPSVLVITETNVPNRDNITYFGNSNEAHTIYNFSLPPLLIFTLLTGNCRHLKTWLMSMPPARHGTTYLNFIASHDGIGLRPTDGLLSATELGVLLDTLNQFGGKISMRTGPDGNPSPYEVNISLIDALAGTVEGRDDLQLARFVCAHAIMLALEGIPAIYIHSLLGTMNDHANVAKTGRYRSINRREWQLGDLTALLEDGSTLSAQVHSELIRLLKLRRKQKAFHPNAIQFTMQLGLEIFGVWRQSIDRHQDIFCIANITDQNTQIELNSINLVSTDTWRDLISGNTIDPDQSTLDLAPYQTVWLSNQ